MQEASDICITKTKKKGHVKLKEYNVDDRELFSLLIVIAQAREYDLKLLFTYELTHVPLAIATSDGEIRKCNKSIFMQQLKEKKQLPWKGCLRRIKVVPFLT